MSEEKKKTHMGYINFEWRTVKVLREPSVVTLGFVNRNGDTLNVFLRLDNALQLCFVLQSMLPQPPRPCCMINQITSPDEVTKRFGLSTEELAAIEKQRQSKPAKMTPEQILSLTDPNGVFILWIACQEGDATYQAIQELRESGKISVEEGEVIDGNGKKLCGHYGLRRVETAADGTPSLPKPKDPALCCLISRYGLEEGARRYQSGDPCPSGEASKMLAILQDYLPLDH